MFTGIALGQAAIFQDPFNSFYCETVIMEEEASRILSWLETSAPWRLAVHTFYEQYEFSLLDIDLPARLRFLTSVDTLISLRRSVGILLGANLSERVDATVHKLISGQRIRIHNDFIPGQETHRLLIQLNRGWSDEMGGLLMLFAEDDPRSLNRIILPRNRSGFGFAISPKSHHAVSAIQSGERFTLVYSFYA